jgi:magnesium transporter
VTDMNRTRELSGKLAGCEPPEAVSLLENESPGTVARALEQMNPAQAIATLGKMSEDARRAALAATDPQWAAQWKRNETFEEDTIGRMMAPALAVMPPFLTVTEAVARLADISKKALVSYIFIVGDDDKLVGVLVFREMLLANRDQKLSEVMIRDPFFLPADMPVIDAMRAMVTRHHPSYPVCDREGRLVGIMRGETLFRQQAFELSAQAGSMVGIQKEERLSTPWQRSLRMRQPWLQLNLATAFSAAAVVGIYQATIDRIVVLAIFLPVLAGQSGNTGAQALAVTLRGMTLGELKGARTRVLVAKEAWLGLLNGALVGLTAGAAMFAYAISQGLADAATLAMVVAAAMAGSCVAAGVSGVVVPLALRRLGADPAAASSIFVTTATDCVSMGALLALATRLLP